jgi:hypothetical protein
VLFIDTVFIDSGIASTVELSMGKTGKTLQCPARPPLHAAVHDRKTYSDELPPDSRKYERLSSYLMPRPEPFRVYSESPQAKLPVNDELTGKCAMLKIGLV